MDRVVIKQSKINSKIRRERARERIKAAGLSMKRKFVHIPCSVCGRMNDIHTTQPAIYTPELIKTFKCLKCKERS